MFKDLHLGLYYLQDCDCRFKTTYGNGKITRLQNGLVEDQSKMADEGSVANNNVFISTFLCAL